MGNTDESSIEYDIEDEPIILHKFIMDIALREDNPRDFISLYVLYYFVAKWQKTHQILASTEMTAKALKCPPNRIRKIKKRLVEHGLISDYVKRSKKGKIVGHYIRIN